MRTEISPDQARRIRLVSLDVDGVLTNGVLWRGSGPDGVELDAKQFHVLDGLAIRLLAEAGLSVAFISGKRSEAVAGRAAELGVRHVSLGDPRGKIRVVSELLAEHGWSWEEVAHVADDLADLALLEMVGLPAAVPNAVKEIREAANWIGSIPGGSGAVREFTEALLEARGEWDEVVDAFRREGRFAGGSLEGAGEA